MKILFMGTPDFAMYSLKALVDNNFDVAAVISQMDKPKGRKMEMTMPPVKEYALEKGIKVYQPETLKDNAILDLLKEINPDIIVVVAYGKILPKYVIDYPKYGCINIHGSLLPKLRGAAPIQRSIINGEKYAGVTSMYMNEGLDTGNIIMSESLEILSNETSGELYERLAPISGELLVKTLRRFENGDFSSTKQNDEEASYAPMLSKAEGEINWNNDAQTVHNLIRGLNPWPMAYSYYKGNRFVILDSHVEEASGKAGSVIEANKDGLLIGCKEKSIRITTIKFDGKKQMSVKDYLVGNKIEKGDIIGRSE